MSLAWFFPSHCIGQLCLHVAVALAWMLQNQKMLENLKSTQWHAEVGANGTVASGIQGKGASKE